MDFFFIYGDDRIEFDQLLNVQTVEHDFITYPIRSDRGAKLNYYYNNVF